MITRFKLKPAMIVISLIVLFLSSCSNDEKSTSEEEETPIIDAKAFPTAYGGGAMTTGGRGGRVIRVTNLNDSGPGSFRDAVTKAGSRTIVFDVSGTITLTSLLYIINSNITIAGQTAPEGGITIAGQSTIIDCNNVIIRHTRFKNASYTGEADSYFFNGIIVNEGKGLIIDHCSFTFNDDQGLSMGNFEDVTIQRSLFSNNATGIIAGIMTEDYAGNLGNITFINNLFVDQSHRTPNMGGNLPFEVINNIMFNWISRLSRVGYGNLGTLNYIGNYLKPGDNTHIGSANKIADSSFDGMLYSANNYHTTLYPTPQLNDQELWQTFLTDLPVDPSVFTTTQHPLIDDTYVIKSAADTYTDVLNDVGTNKFLNADGTYGENLETYQKMVQVMWTEMGIQI